MSNLEVVIIKEIAPVIEINFEELKVAMSETLSKYRGYVVTESNLSSCKLTQKELAGIRIQIDKYRKDKKKELSEPIVAFENQCKELISLVESAESPIKAGFQVFDDMKRADKYQAANNTICKAVEARQLSLKYASKLTVIDKYMNLTATVKDVTDDIEMRADALLNEQKNEQAMLEVIQISIDNANLGINAKLSIDDFKRSIDNGVGAKDIISDINARAERIRLSEIPKTEIFGLPVDTVIETVIKTLCAEAETETSYIFEVKITATESQLRTLKQYFAVNGINYEKISLEEV